MDNIQNFSDKDMLCDIIATEKFIADKYNSTVSESTTAKIQNTFVNILDDEYSILYDLSCELSNRGWYTFESATQEKIDTTRQKFASF